MKIRGGKIGIDPDANIAMLDKSDLRTKIQGDVARFLADGGTINQVGYLTTGSTAIQMENKAPGPRMRRTYANGTPGSFND